MTPERWERIKELFEAALERSPEDRSAFLAEASADDPALRDEVLRLLADDNQPDSFLDKPLLPPLGIHRQVSAPQGFVSGEIISGRYEIVRFIGQGGMGQVYEAKDLELRERVALKTIRPEIASDECAIERFKREIQTARSVRHPNVCGTFDLGYHSTGPDSKITFLTMELLLGETLSSRLKRVGRMTTAEAMPIVQQMAAGLEAAHQAGVIHRDFKPGNVILVERSTRLLRGSDIPHSSKPPGQAPKDKAEASFPTPELRAVITDFGLARSSPRGESTVESISAGLGFAGTPDYMAPEQMTPEHIKGGEITAAADIYALGVVMFEMVTGTLPFAGDTPISAAIRKLNEEPPPPRSHVPDLDPKWEAAILRCLEREPANRFASAADAVRALTGEPVPAGRRRLLWRTRRRWAPGLAVGVAIAVAILYAFMRPLPEPRILNTSQLTRDGQHKAPDHPILASGSRIYFVEAGAEYSGWASVPVEGGDVTRITTPRGLSFSDVSADGSELLGVGFRQDNAETLWVWPVSGGSPRRLGDLRGEAAAWSPDRSKVFYATAEALFMAGADGTNPRRLASVRGRPLWPRWSPDGSVIRFTVWDIKTDTYSLWEVAASGGDPHELLPGRSPRPRDCCGTWTPAGKYYVFQSTRNGRTDIWALPEHAGFLNWRRREPIRVTSGPMSYYAPQPGSSGKKLLVVGDNSSVHLERLDLGTGTFRPYLPGVPAAQLHFSLDGQWVAYVTYPEHTLWRSRVDGSDRRPLTDPVKVYVDGPHWSPDGKQIAFMGGLPDGRYRVCLVSADGGDVTQPVPGDDNQGIPTWSLDGKQIIFGERLYHRDTSLMAIHRFNFETRELSTLPESDGLWTARWSPDGRYIAALRVYLHKSSPELTLFERTTQKWMPLVSKVGTINELAWSRGSRYIYFDTGQGTVLYRVRVPDGKPERLASLKDIAPGSDAWSGVTPDGSPLIARAEAFQEIYALDMDWPY